MKKIKKSLALLLIISLVLIAFSACGNNIEPAKGTEETIATAQPWNEGDPIRSIKINGVDLCEYRIVIPENSDLSARYAAHNLSDFLIERAGIELEIVDDSTEEAYYEILIGNTNRFESEIDFVGDASKCEYIFYRDGSKLVCQGSSYMVGGGIGELISLLSTTVVDGEIDLDDLPTEVQIKTFQFKSAKNAILMIGDGMGFHTVEMAIPTIKAFVAKDLPNICSAYTGSVNTENNFQTPTDSAAAGTALATATKTKNGYIGIDKDQNILKNIRELAHDAGAKTGVITTDVITGATPGAFLVHHPYRSDVVGIQAQIERLQAENGIDWCVGSVGNDLTDNIASALKDFSSDRSSFFLMVEEGHIDTYSHNNDMENCINAVGRFNDATAYVIQFVLCHPDTVLIITADHETGGIIKDQSGNFQYTTGNHSTVDVPVYSIGDCTDCFNNKTIDNTDIPNFIAKIYGEYSFG